MVAKKRETPKPLYGLAVASLRQQAEIIDSGTISLDSLWRAAGEPSGKDPRAWAQLASPLVSGFADYLAKLSQATGRPSEEHPILWEWNDGDGDPWRTGDLMSVAHIAHVYAAFLDAESGEEPGAQCSQRHSPS
jgi:hypothetical protein